MSEREQSGSHHGQDTSSGSSAPYVPSPTPGAPSRHSVHHAHVQSAQLSKQNDADEQLYQDIKDLHITLDMHQKIDSERAKKFPSATPQVTVAAPNPQTPFNTLRALPEDANIEDVRPMLEERLMLVLQQLAYQSLSPHQRQLYERYRNDVETLLAKPDLEVNIFDYLSGHENSIKMHELYRTKANQELSELREKLLIAKQLEVWARYGDYLADRWTLIRHHMNTVKDQHDASVLEYCTNVHEKLQVEFNACQRDQSLGRFNNFAEKLWNQPWHQKLSFAANELGFELDEAKFAIEEYAARNNNMHAGLKDATSRFDWKHLVARVDADLKLLPNLFTSTQQETAVAFQKIITDYRDKWVVDLDGTGLYTAREPIYKAMHAGVSFEKISKELASLPPKTSDAKMDKKLQQLIKEADLSKKQAAKTLLNKEQTKKLKKDKAEADEKVAELEEQLKEMKEQLEEQSKMKQQISDLEKKLVAQDVQLTMYRQRYMSGKP